MKADAPDTPPVDYTQPVAYDKDGRPLFAHPPATAAPPQVVHMSRAVQPVKPEITADVKAKHQKSLQRYPFLNLSEGEYVISAVQRHPIGLFIPVSVTIILVTLVLGVLFSYSTIADPQSGMPSVESLFFPMVMLAIAFLAGGFIAVYVYLSNKFFLTNESVIQEIQHSLFSRREQTVSLANIEDASYRQQGILQSLLDYGSIRLSTEGDETTYRFYYVAHPKEQIAKLNNAVEAFKNGRPVDDN